MLVPVAAEKYSWFVTDDATPCAGLCSTDPGAAGTRCIPEDAGAYRVELVLTGAATFGDDAPRGAGHR